MTSKILAKKLIDTVIYYGECVDGFCSAFIVWMYMKEKYGLEKAKQIDYIPFYYDKLPTIENSDKLDSRFVENFRNRNILICNFSLKYNQLIQLIDVANELEVLNHHKINVMNLSPISDEMRSGVEITWNYLFPQRELPTFLTYIRDKNIRTGKIPDADKFIAYFCEKKFSFEELEIYLLDEKITEIVQLRNKFICVGYNNNPEFQSDIGIQMLKDSWFLDFVVMYYQDIYKNVTFYNLRSDDNRMNVFTIAQLFGGNGHRNISNMFRKGLQSILWDTYPDLGIFELLQHRRIGEIIVTDKNKIPYTHFIVKEIKEDWIKSDYFEFIKRKVKDSFFIIFEMKTNNFKFNEIDNVLLYYNKYVVYINQECQINEMYKFFIAPQKQTYNEYEYQTNEILKLFFASQNEALIEFESEKDFVTIISSIFSKKIDFDQEDFQGDFFDD